jgi:hypothetical protein
MSDKITYGVALLERPLDCGITSSEATMLFNKLHGTEAIPIEFQAEFSSAMGWINLTDAEILKYDYAGLNEFIVRILENVDNEKISHEYTYDDGRNEIEIFLSR